MGKIGKPFLDMLFLCPQLLQESIEGKSNDPSWIGGGNEGRKPLLDMGMVIISQSVVVFFSFWGVVDFKGKILVPLSTFSIS